MRVLVACEFSGIVRDAFRKLGHDAWSCDLLNPVGIMSTVWRKPDQVIQPYMFGHPERKTTCLWLKGLPCLVPTELVPLPELKAGQSKRSLNKLDHLSPSPERWKKRSTTYTGIADAMAAQWGGPCLS